MLVFAVIIYLSTWEVLRKTKELFVSYDLVALHLHEDRQMLYPVYILHRLCFTQQHLDRGFTLNIPDKNFKKL